MNNIESKKYGETQEVDDIKTRADCREIVKRILEYGVSDIQKVHIINFLALELESRDTMIDIDKICKNYLQDKNSDKNIKGLITLD